MIPHPITFFTPYYTLDSRHARREDGVWIDVYQVGNAHELRTTGEKNGSVMPRINLSNHMFVVFRENFTGAGTKTSTVLALGI